MRLIFSDLTYEKLGGGENMIYSIAKAAYRHHSVSSVLVGSSNSMVLKLLNDDGIPFDFYDVTSGLALPTTSTDFFIHFHNYDDLYRLKKNSGRSIVWIILAPQVTGWNRFGIEKKLIGINIFGKYFTKKFIQNMMKKNALISMDGATSDAIENFVGQKLNLPIIPIPIDINDARRAKIKIPSADKPLCFSYIGRSDNVWKIKPVKKIIKDLQQINNRRSMLNIYTDEAEPYLKEFQLSGDENVRVDFHHGYYGSKLRDHLTENSDLHFSMGTAAIEGALSGIATILLDPCLDELPSAYRYKWLYQTDRNSLGRFVDRTETTFTGIEMSEIVSICSDEIRYEEVARKSLEYVIKNHSVSKIIECLINHNTLATNSDICRWTPATWWMTKKFFYFYNYAKQLYQSK